MMFEAEPLKSLITMFETEPLKTFTISLAASLLAAIISWLFTHNIILDKQPNRNSISHSIRMHTQSNQLRLFELMNPPGKRIRIPWCIWKWFTIAINIVYLVLVVVITILIILAWDSKFIALWWVSAIIIAGVLFSIYSLVDTRIISNRVRRGDNSRVYKEANLMIEAKQIEIVNRSIKALIMIGADINSYNIYNGIITASTDSTKITISISTYHDDVYDVKIGSDSISPSVIIDFGMNKRNVNFILSELLE